MVFIHWREKLILEVLKNFEKLNTSDIVKKTDMSKVTVLKYLERLKKRRVIDYKKIGPTKLWYIFNKKVTNGIKIKSKDEKISKLLQELEKLTGIKAKIVITSQGLFLISEKEK